MGRDPPWAGDVTVKVIEVSATPREALEKIARREGCTLQEARWIAEVAGGNPGAATALARTVAGMPEDRVNAFLTRVAYRFQGRAPVIWVCYKDHCDRDTDLFKREVYQDGATACQAEGYCRYCTEVTR